MPGEFVNVYSDPAWNNEDIAIGPASASAVRTVVIPPVLKSYWTGWYGPSQFGWYIFNNGYTSPSGNIIHQRLEVQGDDGAWNEIGFSDTFIRDTPHEYWSVLPFDLGTGLIVGDSLSFRIVNPQNEVVTHHGVYVAVYGQMPEEYLAAYPAAIPAPDIPWSDFGTFAEISSSATYDLALITIPPMTLVAGATLFVNIVSDHISVDGAIQVAVQFPDSSEAVMGSLGIATELGGSAPKGAMWGRALNHPRLGEGGTIRVRFGLNAPIFGPDFATGIVAAMILNAGLSTNIVNSGGYGRHVAGAGVPLQHAAIDISGEGPFHDPYPWYAVSFEGRLASLPSHITPNPSSPTQWYEGVAVSWPGNGSFGFGAQSAAIAVLARDPSVRHAPSYQDDYSSQDGANSVVWQGEQLSTNWAVTRNWLITGGTGLTAHTIFGWGFNDYGQLGDGTTLEQDLPVPAAGGLDLVAISGDVVYESAHGLTPTGDVYGWGQPVAIPPDQQLSPYPPFYLEPLLIAGPSSIVKIVGAQGGPFALASNGDLWTWGPNSNGAKGIPVFPTITSPVITASGVANIWSSWTETTILMLDGSVQMCGDNQFGGLGDGTNAPATSWVEINPVSGKHVVQSAAYRDGQYLLMDDGTVYFAGNNNDGAFGFSTIFGAVNTWTQINSLSEITLIHANLLTGYFVRSDGTTWAIGRNEGGKLGVGLTFEELHGSATPMRVLFPEGVYPVQFGTGSQSHVPIVRGSDGLVYTWGYGFGGGMGNGLSPTTSVDNPAPIANPFFTAVLWVGGGCTGATNFVKGTFDSSATPPPVSPGISSVVAWGLNDNGVLGDGVSNTQHLMPVPQGFDPDFVQIAAAGMYPVAWGLDADGVVYAWGGNERYGLGTGTSDTLPHPMASVVPGLPTIVRIVASLDGCFALAENGDLWTWGGNQNFALGYNFGNPVTEPVITHTNVAGIYASSSETLIVLDDGTMLGCGLNEWGGAGTGTIFATTEWETVPHVGLIDDVVVSTASSNGTQYVLMENGTVWSVGNSQYGQRGFVNPFPDANWSRISSLSGVSMIHAVGSSLFCVLTSGATVALGLNGYGDLGAGLDPGVFLYSEAPVNVLFPAGVRPTGFGTGSLTPSVIARGSDARVYVWGYGGAGAMGNGEANDINMSPMPVALIESSQWVAGDGFWMFAETPGTGVPSIVGLGGVGPQIVG